METDSNARLFSEIDKILTKHQFLLVENKKIKKDINYLRVILFLILLFFNRFNIISFFCLGVSLL